MERQRLRLVAPMVRRSEARVAPPVKVAEAFYLSAEWRAFSREIVRQRGRRCESCGTKGGRLIADHIEERRDGGADFDPLNIQVLCPVCDNRKRAKAAAARG
jgi:5-methylcytosine-specific restriction endonuclease McrA